MDKLKIFEDKIRLLQTILNHSFGNVFVTDKNGKIIYVNKNTLDAFGVSEDILLSMSVYELVKRKMANRAAAIDVIETKKKCIRSVTLDNGTNLAVSAEPIFDAAGELQYVVVFSQNKLIVDTFMKEVQQENQFIRQTLSHVLNEEYKANGIVANSPKTAECLRMAAQAARLDSAVLLQGESGVGKEVISRFVHEHSMRKNQLFMPVNCAAIPRELMESEFFGYEKGAFTGAGKEGKAGLFQLADGGTLFLDEIGELDLSMQSKLLRVLESGEIRKVGGSKNVKIDVRIISATNRDLKKMIHEGKFREDLYYRLSVIPVRIPPLRERKEDIGELAIDFLDKLNKRYSSHRQFSEGALTAFAKYDWPGNVRELRNVVERIFVVSEEDVITERQVCIVIGPGISAAEETDHAADAYILKENESLKDATEQFQRKMVQKALQANNGDVEKTAKILGLGRSGLYKKMDKLGLKKKY